MKRSILILAAILFGLTVAQAQSARQLYLGYENKDKPASATDKKVTKKTPPVKGKPGTKVTIERMRDGKTVFVSPNAVFRSGDKIRLHFETNFDGYVKIINIGSSGKASLLFPYDGADERITASDDVQIPANDGDWIVFDDTPGTEIMTVLMSDKPLDFNTDDELKSANKNYSNSRDLTIQTDADATYAVTDKKNLQKPLGFTLRLKHQ